MKFTKMSLVAALLIGSSAFALENTKISGNANVFYNTSDASNGTLFDKGASTVDIGLNLNVTTDLLKNDMVAVSAGAGYTALTTLGLENNFVSGVWGNAHTATANGSSFGAKVEDANWFNEAWVTATAGKTTAKVGRMELDTPLAFTETWSIEKNTFDAAVVINQDLPDTTLVGAFVGNGNGTETFGTHTSPASSGVAMGGLVNGNGDFETYGTNGAYAVGAINNSWKPLTAQAWYYDVTRVATAFWVQGDLDVSSLGVDGLTMGGQYSGVTAAASGSDENAVGALMVGYAMKGMFSAKLAYSQASSKGSLGRAGFNTATDKEFAQSKLYTEAWWNYGQVTIAGAKAINLTVEAPTPYTDLGLYITNVNQNAKNSDLTEVTLTASKSFGALDTSLAYINTSLGNGATSGSTNTNTLQAYLTLNF